MARFAFTASGSCRRGSIRTPWQKHPPINKDAGVSLPELQHKLHHFKNSDAKLCWVVLGPFAALWITALGTTSKTLAKNTCCVDLSLRYFIWLPRVAACDRNTHLKQKQLCYYSKCSSPAKPRKKHWKQQNVSLGKVWRKPVGVLILPNIPHVFDIDRLRE